MTEAGAIEHGLKEAEIKEHGWELQSRGPQDMALTSAWVRARAVRAVEQARP